MQDRFASGFYAGLIGGIAMNIINITSYYLNIAQLRLLDWAAIAIYGAKPATLGEALFAQLAQLIFVGLLGIIFAYLIPFITSKNFLLRGLLYGMASWFSIYGLALLFQLQSQLPVQLGTAMSDLVGASTYGLVLAETFKGLVQKE